MSRLVVGFALLQYGSVRVYEQPRQESDGAVLPSGELRPPLDHWAALLPRCQTLAEIVAVLEHARSCTAGGCGPSPRRRARPSTI
jgi:hypothetical protein